MKKLIYKFLIVITALIVIVGVCACKKSTTSVDNNKDEPINTKPLCIQESNVELVLGDSVYLHAQYLYDKGKVLKWGVQDENILSVEQNGKITATDVGATKVTLTYGNEQATCDVKVGLGNQIPVLEFENILSIESGLTLMQGENYSLNPIIKFNGKSYDDVTVRYVVENPSIGQFDSEEGIFSAKQTGSTNIQAIASWRGVNATTLTQSFTVSVIPQREISIFVNNEVLKDLQLYTVESVLGKPETYKNESEFVVTAYENGEDRSQDVSVSVVQGEDVVVYDDGKIRARSFGEAKVKISFMLDGQVEYSKFCKVYVKRPIVRYENTVKMFSAADGDLPLISIFKDNVTIVDAYDENGVPLTVENNRVLGLETNTRSVTKTVIRVGDNKVEYLVSLEAYTKVLNQAEDLEYFVQKTQNSDGYYCDLFDGYYILENNIEATDSVFEQKGMDTATAIYSYKPIAGLSGTFDGNGYCINGLEMRGLGLFFYVAQGATVKNLALTNITLSGHHTSTFAGQIRGKIEDVYVHIAKLKSNGHQGILATQIYAQYANMANLSNVIIQCDADYTNGTYYFGSMVQRNLNLTNGVASQNISDVYVISRDILGGENTTRQKMDAPNRVCPLNNDNTQLYLYGVKRYDTLEDWKTNASYDDIPATPNNYDGFLYSGCWEIKDGVPVWKEKANPVSEIEVYEPTVLFSAYEEDRDVDVEAIFGDGEKLAVAVDYYDQSISYPITGNKIGNIENTTSGIINKQLILMTESGKQKVVTLRVYTRLIDEVADLDMFIQTSGSLKALNGYYGLSKDINATGETFAQLATEGNDTANRTMGLTGTFDGNGYTIDGLTITGRGLFYTVAPTGVVKNLALTNVALGTGNYTSAIAGLFCGAIENSYIQVSSAGNGTNSSIFAQYVLVASYCSVTFKNVVLDTSACDSVNTKGALTRWISNQPIDKYAKIENFYVISSDWLSMDAEAYRSDAENRETQTKNDGTAIANNVWYGVKRYDSVADWKENKSYDGIEATDNDYSSFTGYWTEKDGIVEWIGNS